jgi:hypothetical protein
MDEDCFLVPDILVLIGRVLAAEFTPSTAPDKPGSPLACNRYFFRVNKALSRLLTKAAGPDGPWTSRLALTRFYFDLALQRALAPGDLGPRPKIEPGGHQPFFFSIGGGKE